MKPVNRFLMFTVVSGAIILCSILAAGCLKESSLSIQGINVGAQSVSSPEVTLNVSTEIENFRGFGAGTTTLNLRAFNTETGLIENERTDTLNGIGWGGSRTVFQTIVLPRKGSYRLVATVFEGDKRKAQGEITVYNLERLTPDDQKTGLSIEDIDFIVKNVSGGSVNIQCDLYFSNNDIRPSGPFDVEVKAKEMDAHLVADKQIVPVANVDPEKIMVVPVHLTVPDQYNYVMEVLVWKNETIIRRGEGTVQLRPGTTIPAGDQFVTKKIETSKFISDQGSVMAASLPYAPVPTRAPGFGASAALVALVAFGIYAIGQRRKK
jgi:hypothetical protein